MTKFKPGDVIRIKNMDNTRWLWRAMIVLGARYYDYDLYILDSKSTQGLNAAGTVRFWSIDQTEKFYELVEDY